MITNFKLFESNEPDITSIIIQLAKEYKEKYNCSDWDINNGYCDDFAMDVIERMGGYKDDFFELSGDMFFNIREPVEELKELWGDVIITDLGVWSKDMLELYGYPPTLDFEDEISHVWIYYNGKHYDSELPQGSEHWYDIPLIKKLIK